MALMAATGWLGSAPNAAGQVIDQYLNTNVPGFGSDPGVTVASRAHPEYEALGVRLGNYVLTPVLAESAGYDDNVTGTRNARGSALIETNASLDVVSETSATRLGAAFMVDDIQYLERSSQGYTNWSVAAGGSHDFGRDVLYVGATHLNLTQTPRDLDVPGLDNTIAYRVDDARGNFKIDLGRASLTPGIDVAYYSFDNGSVAGQPYLQSYRNRLSVTPGVEGSYEFATRRRAVIILRDTQADFDHTLPGIPRQNYNDFSILAGLAYDADGVIGFRLLGGYERRQFSSDFYKTIQAPILEGSVTWTPTGLTTVTGTAARYIEDAASEATSGYTETALKVTVDHEFLRNVIVTAHGGLYLDDYQAGNAGSTSSQSFVTAGLGGTWKINRNMRLVADYTYSNRNSSNTAAPSQNGVFNAGQAFGGNYSENTFRLTLRFAL